VLRWWQALLADFRNDEARKCRSVRIAARWSFTGSDWKRGLEKAQSMGKPGHACRAINSSSALAIAHFAWHGDLAGDLGFWVSLWLIWGLFHQDFAIELRVQNPDAFIPWAILFPFNLISAIYS
jgi:hypothetical protein